MEQLKFPIGKYTVPEAYSSELLTDCIATIESFPKKLKQEVEKLSEEQLSNPYRADGWSVAQLVNHCADSHINALIRVKLALTEKTPTICPYPQDLWAELADGKIDIQAALNILDGTHARWAILLKSLTEGQWQRGYIHPEKGREVSLKESASSYAWHCKHHLAHITELKKRMNWL